MSIIFIRPGRGMTRTCTPTKKMVNDNRWLGKWMVASDLTGARKPFMIPTKLKPDIFMWSDERKMLELVELTVPYEENIDAARDRKEERYTDLVEECKAEGWKTWHSPIEIGCRGFVGLRFKKWFMDLGFSHKNTKDVMKRIQETTEKASHWIWIKREDPSWFE